MLSATILVTGGYMGAFSYVSPLLTDGAGLPVSLVPVLLGATGMAVPPVATGLAVRHASSAPTLAATLSVSAFNVGIALGSWMGGRALDSSLGASGPALIGAVGAALGLVPLLALARAGERAAHAERTAVAQHREPDATELAPASPPTGP